MSLLLLLALHTAIFVKACRCFVSLLIAMVHFNDEALSSVPKEIDVYVGSDARVLMTTAIMTTKDAVEMRRWMMAAAYAARQ